MQNIKRVVKKACIFAVVLVCTMVGAGALLRGAAPLTGSANGGYVITAHAVSDTNTEALINFYKEEVARLNKQCNILLIIAVLLLIALIITRLIQPQQSIYEIQKSIKRADKKAEAEEEKKADDLEREDIFEDAVRSAKPREFEYNVDVTEDSVKEDTEE
ncbi:MAG: hypothetical protein IJM37_05030 [Lachnospiraceae bacterium]|nr:hypothetical protein [Lachnospiraceae bacterium]